MAIRMMRRLLAVLAIACLSAPALGHVMFTTMGAGNTSTTTGALVIGRRVALPESIIAAKCVLSQNGAVIRYHVTLGPTSGTIPIPIRVQVRGGSATSNVPGNVMEEFTTTVRLTQPAVLSFDSTVFPVRFAGDVFWINVSVDGSLISTVNWSMSPTGATGATASRNPDGSFTSIGTSQPLPAISIEGEPLNGACCNPASGQCVLQERAQCQLWTGFTYNPTSGCTATACSQTGACCIGAACTVGTPNQCSGAFRGGGTTCGTTGGFSICCKADFDNSGSLAVQDIFEYLNAWFASCP